MIGEILPHGVATAESSSDASEHELYPEELALIERAVPKRRAEFATARVCARRALAQLGVPPSPILRGETREPLWPEGIVGSLTHCTGMRAAAVARATDFRSIGIDAEPDEPLPDGILERISLPAERAQLAHADRPNMDRLLFSAKESVYKAWFPLAHRWLGFCDAEIAMEPDGTFDVRLLVSGPIASLSGRWLARDGLLLTAIAVPHGSSCSTASSARL
jgi:4'-phosphopantetheinyl transferase EntD